MKAPDRGVIVVPGARRCGWFLEFYNQWGAVLRPQDHNWQDWNLTVWTIAFENSPYKRSCEIALGLLGFTVIVTYVFRDTEPMRPEHETG